MTKNVQGVRNICLEWTLYVQASFVEFYVFIFYEIHVRGSKNIYDRIFIGNVREIIPKDHLRAFEEGAKTVCMAVPGRPK